MHSRHTATPDKTAGFINWEVIGRKKRCTGLKTDAADRPEELSIEATIGQATVGHASVNLYIAAVVKLWELQKRQRVNDPHVSSSFADVFAMISRLEISVFE